MGLEIWSTDYRRRNFNERCIVDWSWIRESIGPRTAPEGEGDRYGYGWHLSTVTVDGHAYGVVSAGATAVSR